MLDKSNKSKTMSNVSTQQIAYFDRLADQWWDPKGKYKTALAFNKARLQFIQRQIDDHFSQVSGRNSISILDVGCGGGLISEPLAQAGYEVVGVDPSATSVEVAKRHALKNNVGVTYYHATASELDPSKKKYDVVINAEVVEHVPDQQALIAQCADLVKPGGMMILATLNRTLKSYVVAILGAEYLLRYLPIGTHSWGKFVTPKELIQWSDRAGFGLLDSTGLSLNVFNGRWSLRKSLAVNYVLSLTRQ